MLHVHRHRQRLDAGERFRQGHRGPRLVHHRLGQRQHRRTTGTHRDVVHPARPDRTAGRPGIDIGRHESGRAVLQPAAMDGPDASDGQLARSAHPHRLATQGVFPSLSGLSGLAGHDDVRRHRLHRRQRRTGQRRRVAAQTLRHIEDGRVEAPAIPRTDRHGREMERRALDRHAGRTPRGDEPPGIGAGSSGSTTGRPRPAIKRRAIHAIRPSIAARPAAPAHRRPTTPAMARSLRRRYIKPPAIVPRRPDSRAPVVGRPSQHPHRRRDTSRALGLRHRGIDRSEHPRTIDSGGHQRETRQIGQRQALVR